MVPLHYWIVSLQNDDKKQIKYLKKMLQLGANINHVNARKDTALHLAVRKGLFHLASAILKGGIFWDSGFNKERLINQIDINGNTALNIASANRDKRMVDLLIDSGAKH